MLASEHYSVCGTRGPSDFLVMFPFLFLFSNYIFLVNFHVATQAAAARVATLPYYPKTSGPWTIESLSTPTAARFRSVSRMARN
jgi:hypothetical protein